MDNQELQPESLQAETMDNWDVRQQSDEVEWLEDMMWMLDIKDHCQQYTEDRH